MVEEVHGRIGSEGMTLISKLDNLPPEMEAAYVAAREFMERHPDLKLEDALYERSISARVMIAYHERLAESVEQYEAQRAIHLKNMSQMTAERNDLARRLYQRESENWKQVCASDVFQELKHGKYRDIMTLLSDGEISVGKAAEAIAERAGGVEPFLPDWNPPEHDAELSWKERYDKLKASIPAERVLSRLMGLEDGAQAYSADNFEKVEAERDALAEQLEHDRSLVADCVTAATKAVQMRDWLIESRGEQVKKAFDMIAAANTVSILTLGEMEGIVNRALTGEFDEERR